MVKKTSFREGLIPDPRKFAQRKGQGSQKPKKKRMTGKKLVFGTFKTSLFTIGAVAAMLLTACGFEAIETPEEAEEAKQLDATEQYISGLNNLNKARLQVGKEVNLLDGITLGEGVELIKTEIESEGQRSKISDPEHYTPTHAGPCYFLFRLKIGNDIKEKSSNLVMVEAKEYRELVFEEGNIINDFNPNLNCLSPESREFTFRRTIVPGYLASTLYHNPNIEHIILGEVGTDPSIENVGLDMSGTSHADDMGLKKKTYAPGFEIKYCGGNWNALRQYVEKIQIKYFQLLVLPML